MACSNVRSNGQNVATSISGNNFTQGTTASSPLARQTQLGCACRTCTNGNTLFNILGRCRFCGNCLNRAGAVTTRAAATESCLTQAANEGVCRGECFSVPCRCRFCGRCLNSNGVVSSVNTTQLVSTPTTDCTVIQEAAESGDIRECCDTVSGCGKYLASSRDTFWPTFTRPRWLTCAELYSTRLE
ncbi:hypothetical protein U6B65_13295 [Oscillospiraceae bacterium MB08-C2-2]|nr:hypothetical protein U6B65_13295 [Oscillospiraceae bacterium MB08-C2-2]